MKHLILTLLTVGLISAHAEGTKDNFGTTRDGESVERYTLKNKHGMVAKVITLGGIITELPVPDRAGKLADIALGFDTVAEYEEHNGGAYFGCITGRVANRIAGGKFDLDGKSYKLDLHPKTSFHLHGGLKGFSKVIWKAEPVTDPRGSALKLAYLSKDGGQGFPANLNPSVTYVITDQPGVQFYTATFTTTLKAKSGQSYDLFHGFCLETQHDPDSVHHAELPTTIHQFTTR